MSSHLSHLLTEIKHPQECSLNKGGGESVAGSAAPRESRGSKGGRQGGGRERCGK